MKVLLIELNGMVESIYEGTTPDLLDKAKKKLGNNFDLFVAQGYTYCRDGLDVAIHNTTVASNISDTYTEICTWCQEEVKIPAIKGAHTCPNCGEEMLACGLCDMDEVECNKCPYDDILKHTTKSSATCSTPNVMQVARGSIK